MRQSPGQNAIRVAPCRSGKWESGAAGSVFDSGEVEALGRGHGTAGLAVAGVERGLELADGPAAGADLDQGASHRADLAVEEGAGGEGQPHLLPFTPDPGLVE